MKLTQFSNNFQKTIKTSLINGPSRLGGNDSKQISLMKFVNMKPQLRMISA